MANIKKNDNVKVISGANKGKTGTVISVKAGKVVVSGVNVRKRHEKPSQTNRPVESSRRNSRSTFPT
jgi:Ribosomal protein L24